MAVFDIESRGARITSSLADNLVDHIETRLVSSGRFAVVPRSEVKRVLRGQTKESYKECYEESCQIEVGKELAAEKTLATRISKIGSTCTVSLKLYDLRKSVAEAGRTGEGRCSPDGIFKALKKALEGMLGGTKVGTSVSISPSPNDDDIERELARARAEEAKDKAEKEALRKEASKRWPKIREYAQAKRINRKKRIEKLKGFIARYGQDNVHRTEAEMLLVELRADAGAMVQIPAGDFVMGCNEPMNPFCGHKISKKKYLPAFRIDKTEVTVAQYKRCVDAGRCKKPKTGHFAFNWNKPGRENHPINGVSWYDANTYCGWVKKRLPTGTEWEKAARGTDGRKYSWGNEKASCQYAVITYGGEGCGKRSTWPVGFKKEGASPYGSLDMIGNVSEWTADRSGGKNRVIRGGSWASMASSALTYKISVAVAGKGSGDVGFRCSSDVRPD